MNKYDKLRIAVDTFNQHWKDGTLKELGTQLPKLIVGQKRYTISDVKEKSYMQSGVMDFNNIDTPGNIRALHSAVVEAEKPW